MPNKLSSLSTHEKPLPKTAGPALLAALAYSVLGCAANTADLELDSTKSIDKGSYALGEERALYSQISAANGLAVTQTGELHRFRSVDGQPISADSVPVEVLSNSALGGPATYASVGPGIPCAIADATPPIICFYGDTFYYPLDEDPLFPMEPDLWAIPVSLDADLPAPTALASARDTQCALSGGQVSCWHPESDEGRKVSPTILRSLTDPDLNPALALNNIVSLSAGDSRYICGATQDGLPYCWHYSESPDGPDHPGTGWYATEFDYLPRPNARKVKQFAGKGKSEVAVMVAPSRLNYAPEVGHTRDMFCVLAQSGRVYCGAGDSHEYHSNLGTLHGTLTPVPWISRLDAAATAIGISANHACVLSAGEVYCGGFAATSGTKVFAAGDSPRVEGVDNLLAVSQMDLGHSLCVTREDHSVACTSNLNTLAP